MNANPLPRSEKTSTHLARTATAALTLAILLALIIVATPAAQAQTFKVIYNFTGGADGAEPTAGLTIDAAGNLYGTTSGGGASYGTVFRLRRSRSGWVLTTLYSFAGDKDGAYPQSTVAFAPDGTLYGTTVQGGGGECNGLGCGTVFQLTPSPAVPESALAPWNETVLHRFTGTDGENPNGYLTLDQSGNIYGTTTEGGTINSGVVYQLTPSSSGWTETPLHSIMQNTFDGVGPQGGVVFDRSGNLYGVFAGGGRHYGGAVYRLSPSGSSWAEQILYSFTGGDDGLTPVGGLIMDSSGNLYGVTESGGSRGGGTVFELTPTNGGWTLNTLYSFPGCTGCGPNEQLVMDAAGNLYGTTFDEGAYGYGNIFKLMPVNGGWTYTSLYDFTGGNDGGLPDLHSHFRCCRKPLWHSTQGRRLRLRCCL